MQQCYKIGPCNSNPTKKDCEHLDKCFGAGYRLRVEIPCGMIRQLVAATKEAGRGKNVSHP